VKEELSMKNQSEKQKKTRNIERSKKKIRSARKRKGTKM